MGPNGELEKKLSPPKRQLQLIKTWENWMENSTVV